MHFLPFIALAVCTTGAILAGALACHAIAKWGPDGERLAEMLCRAPGLDVVITYFTVLPLFVGCAIGGWSGLLAAVIGQVAGVLIWEYWQESVHAEAVRGPRIVKVLNAKVGALRNHTALWTMATVVPVFWIIRMSQVVIYPVLVWTVRLPRYNQGEWVNVSRQKFAGLVGHDLIWCLYCDWMTGLWSLGSEMLRNIESFWCPIRFAHGKKCINCQIDFPDVNHGWVDANGTMADVAKVLDEKYAAEGANPWFGHPVRLTVNGNEPVA